MNLEERLRRALGDPRESMPSEEKWRQLQIRLTHAGASGHMSRVVTIVFGLGLGIVAILLAVVALSPHESREDSRALAPPSPHVEATLDLGVPLSDVESTGNVAWFLQLKRELTASCGGNLVQVRADQDGIHQQAVVPIDGTPVAVAKSANRLVFLAASCGPDPASAELLDIDPASGEVVRSLDIKGAGVPSDVAVNGSTAFIVWEHQGGGGTIVAVRVDTGEMIASANLEGRVANVDATTDAVWILDDGPDQGRLLKLDPSTLAVVNSWNVGTSPAGLVVGSDGSAWVGGGDGLIRLRPEGDLVTVATTPGGPVPIGTDPLGIWYLGANPDSPGSIVSHLNERTSTTDVSLSLDVPLTASTTNPPESTIWVASATETSTRIILIAY